MSSTDVKNIYGYTLMGLGYTQEDTLRGDNCMLLAHRP